MAIEIKAALELAKDPSVVENYFPDDGGDVYSTKQHILWIFRHIDKFDENGSFLVPRNQLGPLHGVKLMDVIEGVHIDMVDW